MRRNRSAGSPRVTVLATGASGFAMLFAGAELFGFDGQMLGLTDEAFRPFAHVGVYGLLAVLLAKGLGNRYCLAALLSLTLATVEETRQVWMAGRYASLTDAMLNAVGILSFLLASWVLDHYLAYQRERRRYRHVLMAEGDWHPLTLSLPSMIVMPRRVGLVWLARIVRRPSLRFGSFTYRSRPVEGARVSTAPA